MSSTSDSSIPARRRASRALSLWLPVMVYAAAIFWVSGRPAPPELPGRVSDKQGHLVAYGGLSLVTLRALAGGAWSGVTPGRAVAAALLATAYGGSDELHQRFVPERTADPADLGADAAGAGLAAALAWMVSRLRHGRRAVE